jgi:hypothetical protein
MDGIDHINIYSKAKTVLGKVLSNWSPLPDGKPILTLDGPFQSVEGYWAWLGYAYPAPEYLRQATGFQAKSMILEEPEEVRPDFQLRIKYALEYKCRHLGDAFTEQFIASYPLPLTHYYVYNGKTVTAGFEWVTEEISRVREILRGGS